VEELPEHPVVVDSFALDTFELTVGRFRTFVEQYYGTPPAEGAGAHAKLPGSGWQSGWNSLLPKDKAGVLAGAQDPWVAWTDVPGANESKPMTYVSWYVAFAFCIWDGGWLPTEAEWEYASVGGEDDRLFPWGSQKPDETFVWLPWENGCPGGLPLGLCPPALYDVGSRPKGNGRWGHRDLAGGRFEWLLDVYDAGGYASVQAQGVCDNCANLAPGAERAVRGCSIINSPSCLRGAFRDSWAPEAPDLIIGLRCARSP
jgi:formylglycine-generating enzyme